MKCAHCDFFDIEAHPAHKKVGFGLCQGFPKLRAYFVAIKRDSECERFKQAAEKIIEKRREIWRSK